MSYLEECKLKHLPDEEIRKLISDCQQGNHESQEKIVLSNIGIIQKIISTYFYHYNTTCIYDDLIQVGCESIIKGIYKFDLTKKTSFCTFIYTVIKHDLIKYISMDAKINTNEAFSINVPDENNKTLEEKLHSSDILLEDLVLNELHDSEIIITMRKCFTKLSDREKLIIKLIIFDNALQKDAGKIVGLSPGRLSKVLKATLLKFKTLITIENFIKDEISDTGIISNGNFKLLNLLLPVSYSALTDNEIKLISLYFKGYTLSELAELKKTTPTNIKSILNASSEKVIGLPDNILLNDIFNKLSETEQLITILHFVKEYDVEKICEKLELSPTQVKKYIKKIVAEFQKEIVLKVITKNPNYIFQLQPVQQELIRLYFFERKTLLEISKLRNYSVTNVHTLITKCIDDLYNLLLMENSKQEEHLK